MLGRLGHARHAASEYVKRLAPRRCWTRCTTACWSSAYNVSVR
jgi:hypothetical protein